MYKLLVLDMDGTLLNDKGYISKKNIKSITKARNRGVEVVLATGRLLASANYFAQKLKLKSPLISSNGALLTDCCGKIIFNKILKEFQIKEVSKIAEEIGTYYHLYGKDSIYSKIIHEKMLKYYKDEQGSYQMGVQIFKDIKDIIHDEKIQINKILLKECDIDKRKILKNEIENIVGIETTSSWNDNLEVIKKGVSKGNALEYLAGMYKIDREKIIAVGDNENDISMIEYAGLGISVSNGITKLKEKADYITKLSNDEDAISEIIYKFIL